MKHAHRYEVALNHKESIVPLFIERELSIPENIKVKHIDVILGNLDYYSKNTDNNIVFFEDFMDMQFVSYRSKNDELVEGKANSDPKKTISAVIAPIRRAVFLEEDEGLLQPFDEVPLGIAYIYNFDSFSIIKHENGNHRLYGCMLFAPYLKRFYVEFKNVTRYSPNEKFKSEIRNLKKIIDKLSTFDMDMEIVFDIKEHPTPDSPGNKNIIATLDIRSTYNDKQSIFKLFNMSLEDIAESLNENAERVIERLNEISRIQNTGINAHDMNKYVFDNRDPYTTYPIGKILNKLTPIHTRILNAIIRYTNSY